MVKNEIKVFARLKPEAKRKNIVNHQIHRRPKKNLEEDYLVLNGVQKSINEYINNRPESWNFAFYKIFDHDIEQDEVFENVAQPVVQSVLNGYNATIFAYGQTGSGKTFSITGDPERYEDRGVLPRTVQYLFETIQKNPDNLYSVEIAYLEIYNENGYDLLDPKHEVVTKLEDLPRVTIQEDETGTLHLKNLSFRSVENEKDALALLFLGDANRAISETPMNPQSSRSHCIFTIAVSVKQSGAQHLTKAKMHLVDLAGSERVYKCCISGTILTEAKHINLSLHYLEQVIVCLGQQNVSHIPYRNSLLTAILRDSLGGNCLTTMLATLSMNISNLEETISTCRFSQRVALIKNDVNLILERNPEEENRFLKIEVRRLRDQIAEMTKRPTIGEELTAKEKQNLNFKVKKFLESEAADISWENDERKMKYCLQVLRENVKTRVPEKHRVLDSEKDLNYYRNLVVQRDKEISALINMLKKSRSTSANDSADHPGSTLTRENRNETSPRISVIAKKVRLRELMVEARSIAELIKNGRASIGDLRTRMTNSNPLVIETLHETLRIEQSRLARNLSLLKTLKSEATDLRTALTDDDSSRRSVAQKSSAQRVERNSRNSMIDDNECRKEYVTSSKTSAPPKHGDVGTSETIRSPEPPKVLQLSPEKEIDDREVVCNSSVKRFVNRVEIRNLTSEITQLDVARNSSSSAEPNTAKLDDANFRKSSRGDGDSERNLFGKSFLETKTLLSGGGGRSSFRAPAFLREILSSDRDCDAGLRPLPVEENTDPNNSSSKLLDDFLTDLPRSGGSVAITEASKSTTNPSTSASKVEELIDADFGASKSGKTPSGPKLSHEQSDKFNEASIDAEKYVKEDFKKSDSRIEQPIFIKNIELNKTEEDLNAREDDSFIKSLPLTGDPEIDEEIIAFYRAKKSGGTY